MPPGTDLSGVVLDGRYQIVERMAEGAMGVVYRGIRTKLNRAVAIKVMHSVLPGAMAARKRFEREAKLMALLEHPHCVSVIDYGLHADKPYVVMELVRGRSLFDLIAEQGRFEIPRAADIVRQVLSGLTHAHEQGIIHRDVKPANIMITPKAPLGVHARILDFGLARLYGANTSLTDGVAVGTPSYMAPEQCRGDKVDERVDIYACGVVLFELITGRKPFVADDPILIIKQHLERPPPRLADVAPGEYGALEDVVARALAKRPDERLGSAVAMSAAIEAALPRDGVTRGAADSTSSFEQHELGSSALVPVPPPSSVDIPITVDSAAMPRAGGDASGAGCSDAKTGVHDPHDASMLRRMLPVSRVRWLVAACMIAVAAGAYAAYAILLRAERPRAAAVQPVTPASDAAITTPPPVAPAPEHPRPAVDAFEAGRGYFARLWWSDGIASFRQAVQLDPSYRSDPELVKVAVRGFTTTPRYDDRLAGFLVWIGAPAAPLLDELAHTHANPEIRARCAALQRRIH